MVGLDPAIHVSQRESKNVDAPDKPGHDESVGLSPKSATGLVCLDPLKGGRTFEA
ncbi:hypothetical protein SAMN05216525_11895 [Bradyrhizobium sp. Gha]|nr:hypothetical protein SAMN05216525_11895 [Bradyrhizobium sp. Gha]